MNNCNCDCHHHNNNNNKEGINPKDNVFTELGFKIAVLNDLKECREENKSLQKAIARLRGELEKIKDSVTGWKEGRGGY